MWNGSLQSLYIIIVSISGQSVKLAYLCIKYVCLIVFNRC